MDAQTQSFSTSADTAGSTLFSIRERELQACPETPEHLAVCLVGGTARRLQQLGFQLPDSLRLGQQMACKAAMLVCGEDVLLLIKRLLDDYERLRAERDDLRTAEKLQRHELGQLARRAASLNQELLMKDKKLADAEYRLEEAAHKADRLRADACREAHKARMAESEGRRLAETAQHRERRTEQELFEARQRLERTGQPVPWRSPRKTRQLRQRGGGGVGGGVGLPLKAPAASNQHAVLACDLFETIDLSLPLMEQQPEEPETPLLARPGRNRSLPTMRQQVWYRVPPAAAQGAASDAAGELSAISLAETIDASGGCCSPQSSSADAATVASSGSSLSAPTATARRRSRGH